MAEHKTALDRILATVPEPQRSETDRGLRKLSADPNDPIFLLFSTILNESEKSRTAGINALRADLKPPTAELQKIGKALFTTGYIRRAVLGRLTLWLAMTVTTVILTLYGINYLSGKQLEELAPYTRNAEAIAALTKSLDETRKLNVTAQQTAAAMLGLATLLSSPDVTAAKTGDEWKIWGRGLTVAKTEAGEDFVLLRNHNLDELIKWEVLRQKIEPAREAAKKAEETRK